MALTSVAVDPGPKMALKLLCERRIASYRVRSSGVEGPKLLANAVLPFSLLKANTNPRASLTYT